MSNHAGFALVASVHQGYINQTILGFFKSSAFFFPLPQTINVAGTTVEFEGIAQIAAPVVEFFPNPQNTARFHFAFFCTFAARVQSQVISVNGQSVSQAFRVRVRLDAAVDLPMYFGPVNGEIILQLNTALVTFQPLKVNILQGPRPPAVIMNALQSVQLANAATNAVRMIRPITLKHLTSSQFNISQPGDFKEANFSVFEWFSVGLNISRIVIKVFDGAVTAAIDFSGITNGDENALTDLTSVQNFGSIYIQRITQDVDVGEEPFLEGATYRGGSNLAFSFNIAVMSRLLDLISPQISGTPMSGDSHIRWVSGGYSYFERDLYGMQKGLGIDLGVTAKGIDATVSIRLQPFFREYDRINFRGTESWLMLVAKVEIDLPLYAEILIGLAHALTVAFGMISFVPLSMYNYRTANNFFNGINQQFAKGDTDNIANAQKLTLQNKVYDASLPNARYISVTENAIDMGFGTGTAPFALPADPGDGAYILPFEPWPAENRAPIITSLKLMPEWIQLINNDLMVVWEVRRKDTNAIIASGNRRYVSPLGNGLAINHHSKELYLVKEFIIRARLFMTLSNQSSEIWSGMQNIVIEDAIDRSHPYVEWGAENVYFANAGTNNKTWSRIARSRIHRTAVAARCKMLKLAVSLRSTAMEREAKSGLYRGDHPKFRYKDALPFSIEHIQQHRKELCEYCFFGGPDKKEPLPVEDWFEPNEPTVKAFTPLKITWPTVQAFNPPRIR